MEIQTIKVNGGGWIINGDTFVPNDPGNRDYHTVLEYIESGGAVDNEFTPEELVAQQSDFVRSKRDRLLLECDYIIMPDYPMVDKTAWESYRQDLRDVTDQIGFPGSVAWPNKPTI